MNVLLAIRSCNRYAQRAQNIRDTWLQSCSPELKYKFFVGDGPGNPTPDTIALAVGDTYNDMPAKVRQICRWALLGSESFDYIHMIDDDVYLRPERLLAAIPEGSHYVGRRRGPSCPCHPYPGVCSAYPADYCSGFSYWLSNYAAVVVAGAELDPQEWAEDRWVGNVLHRNGIEPILDPRYSVVPEREPPKARNDVISSCEYPTREEMLLVHEIFLGRTQLYGVPMHSKLRRYICG